MGKIVGTWAILWADINFKKHCKVNLVSAIFRANCATHLYFLLVIDISSGPIRFALKVFAGELLG